MQKICVKIFVHTCVLSPPYLVSSPKMAVCLMRAPTGHVNSLVFKMEKIKCGNILMEI